jgi:hypothetical protein
MGIEAMSGRRPSFAASRYRIPPSKDQRRRVQDLVTRRVDRLRLRGGSLAPAAGDLVSFIGHRYDVVAMRAATRYSDHLKQVASFFAVLMGVKDSSPERAASAPSEVSELFIELFALPRFAGGGSFSEAEQMGYVKKALNEWDYRKTVEERGSEFVDRLAGAVPRIEARMPGTQALRAVYGARSEVDKLLREILPELASALLPSLEEVAAVELAGFLSEELLGQLHLVEDRLLMTNAELYGRFDRLQGEASLRLAVTPPLLVLTIAFAVANRWFLFALAGVLMLAYSGLSRGREAQDTLVDAMLTADVEAPTLQELREATGQPTPPTREVG